MMYNTNQLLYRPLIDLGIQSQPTYKTMDLEKVQDFAKQIVRGMEHLEKKNITHRSVFY